jgi:polar amino acid transport system substrate-binding protein
MTTTIARPRPTQPPLWLALLLACALATPLAAHGQAVRAVTETTPYTYQKGDRVVGTATEVVEKTLQAAGLGDYQVRLYPWARAYDMALKEPNVLIFLIARTPARETQFQWTGEIMKIQYHLYRLKERTEVAVKTLADAKAYTIGVMRDDVRQQYLQTKGFTRLAVSAQWSDNFAKLIKRQVDLVPLTEDDASSLCQEAHFDCAGLERVLTLDEASTGLYMAYSLATPESTVQKTRAAFDKLKADGTVRRTMERKP